MTKPARVLVLPNSGTRTGKWRVMSTATASLLIALTVSSEAFAASSLGKDPLVLFSARRYIIPKELGKSLAVDMPDKESRARFPNQIKADIAEASSIKSNGLDGNDGHQAINGATLTVKAASAPSTGASVDTISGEKGMVVASQASQQDQLNQTNIVFRPALSSDTNSSTDPDQLLSLYQDGAGQASTSMDELDLVLDNRQIFSDLRTLETRLNSEQRPTFNVVDRNSTQTDHLDINQLEISQDLFFSKGKDNLRLGVQRIVFNAPGDIDVTQYVVGFTGNVKLSDFAAVAGELWVNRLEYSKTTSDTLATYDIFVTLRPSDVIRIDVDTSRRTFDNIRSLQLGLTASSYGGSIDYTPTDRLRLTARAFGASYDDANRRRSEEIETVWRAKTTPLIEIGVRGTNFHFTRLLNNGYFNPKDYLSGEAMFRVQSKLTQDFTIELAGSGGAEDAHPGGIKPLIKGSLQAVYKLENGWSIDGEASHFTSRDSSSSGFARTSFTLGLHYRF